MQYSPLDLLHFTKRLQSSKGEREPYLELLKQERDYRELVTSLALVLRHLAQTRFESCCAPKLFFNALSLAATFALMSKDFATLLYEPLFELHLAAQVFGEYHEEKLDYLLMLALVRAYLRKK